MRRNTEREAVLSAIGANLRTARERRGWSQEVLAAEAGLDRTYVGGVERGERNVAALNLVALANALGVKPGALLEGL